MICQHTGIEPIVDQLAQINWLTNWLYPGQSQLLNNQPIPPQTGKITMYVFTSYRNEALYLEMKRQYAAWKWFLSTVIILCNLQSDLSRMSSPWTYACRGITWSNISWTLVELVYFSLIMIDSNIEYYFTTIIMWFFFEHPC